MNPHIHDETLRLFSLTADDELIWRADWRPNSFDVNYAFLILKEKGRIFKTLLLWLNNDIIGFYVRGNDTYTEEPTYHALKGDK